MNERGPTREPYKNSFLKVERKSLQILEALAHAPRYKKNALVHVRRATLGEEVSTTLADGKVETLARAGENDIVVTNVSGEEYILPFSMLVERYDATDTPGVYRATGYCRAIPNPYGKPIEIIASWKTRQRGDENCFIADTCDAAGNLTGEPYLIEHAVFMETYAHAGNQST